jgi:hypothetical protein
MDRASDGEMLLRGVFQEVRSQKPHHERIDLLRGDSPASRPAPA